MEWLLTGAAWLWQQLQAMVSVLWQQNWGELKVRHFAAVALLYALWHFLLRPLVVRARLLHRFKSQINNKRWFFGRVVKVVDGDTVEVRTMWFRVVRVRLQYIDAPESAQKHGAEATRFLHKQAQGKTVLLVCAQNPDRYGRVLAEIFCPHLRRSLNLTLVEHGLAWAYKGTKAYEVAQQTARRKKAGLWRERRPTNPAQWRQDRKS
ncbi:thermonuclease family protein [Conchiformibius kuhniae]|uniref:Thermonuclease family protein n=1 Tax=Conchiformibius kuhniae TaxID=211502 RepID=A0A8T9MW26_9NEIS|nr:thermonuclease family protein [Conchiformibius kuhniae]UOP05371.1 thermonuclease family protein [Conchiformibius kuhniae]